MSSQVLSDETIEKIKEHYSNVMAYLDGMYLDGLEGDVNIISAHIGLIMTALGLEA